MVPSAVKSARVTAGRASVVGVAKGAAMCAPNMATMLAFLTTDAAVDGATLQGALSAAVDASFNRISIDGCESTNDSVFLLSSGAGVACETDALYTAVAQVCLSLAEQIARDAEGATRLMRVHVKGARDASTATSLGRAVADSVLWRCAVHGADPNWGRVLSALGSVDRDLRLDEVTVSIGREVVFAQGEPVADNASAAKVMVGDEVDVTCTVGSGPASAEVLSADTSPAYVLLNAEGSS